ncbi:ABC transporter permease [Cruoricaptor ignavus]|uniref:ABC transporter permease n=1 Tax=Cruoricaptor ignavus TaxID=1118202 RepID=UPI00370CFDFF
MNNIQVYEPKSQKKSLGELLQEMFQDFTSSLSLAKRIFIRDKKAEYRQSVLGILWAFITPFTNAIVWIFLSASGAINVTGTGIPYPLFVFLGTMIWGIFSESVNMPLTGTNSARALISKINFPKEAILISGFYNLLFNTGIKLIIIISVLLIFGFFPGVLSFAGFLGMLLFIIFFGISIGLLLTPVGMLYKDIGRAIPMALSFLMYITPVVYKETKFPSLQKFIDYNPLTPLINSTRNLAIGDGLDNPAYLLIILIATVFIGFFGWVFYRVSIPVIVERM